VQISVVHMIFVVATKDCRDSSPVNIVARTAHTQSSLEIDSIGHGTKHIMQDARGDIHCMLAWTILLEKCVHMPCSLSDQNDLTLQLQQVPLACYGAVHNDPSN
jgi:hypothetical protein